MNRTQVNLRLDNALIDRLDNAAKADRRSRTQLITMLIEVGLPALERIVAKGGPLQAAKFDAEVEKMGRSAKVSPAAVAEAEPDPAGTHYAKKALVDTEIQKAKKHLHHMQVDPFTEPKWSGGKKLQWHACACGEGNWR